MSSYNRFSSLPSKLLYNSSSNSSWLAFSCFSSSSSVTIVAAAFSYSLAIAEIVLDMFVSLFIVSLFSSKVLVVVSGSILVFPTKSLISILYDFGIARSPRAAINISWNFITSTVFPFATYDNTTFPIMNPTITPTLPSLFNRPAIIPDIAYAANITGCWPDNIPTTVPIVIPVVPPTSTPFFQPITSTIRMHNIFLIEKPNMLKFPKQFTANASIKLAPITSSIENTFFIFISLNTINEFTKTLYKIAVVIVIINVYNKS